MARQLVSSRSKVYLHTSLLPLLYTNDRNAYQEKKIPHEMRPGMVIAEERGNKRNDAQRTIHHWSLGKQRSKRMLSWILVFLVMALISAVLGFGGLAGAFASIAKVLFFLFLVALVVSFVIDRRDTRNHLIS